MNPTGTNGRTLSPRGVLQRLASLLVVALLLAVVLPAGANRLVGAQSQDGATQATGGKPAPAAPGADQGSWLDSLKSLVPGAGDQVDGAAAPDAADALDNKSGGPDAFGYTYDDNESHPAHGRQFQNIANSGTPLAREDVDVDGGLLGNLDDGYWEIELPFPFKYYGEDRDGDDLFVSINGFVTFDADAADSFTNGPIPNGFDPEDAIYAFWDDLLAGNGFGSLTCGGNPGDLDCGVYYQVVGSAPNRRLIVQWNEVPFYADPDAGHVTFQIQLIEATGEIRFEYLDPQACALNDCERGSGGSATIGIEDDDGDTGLQYSFDEPALMSKPGTFIQNIVFHPPHLEITKSCFSPETELHNAPASGTAEVILAGQQWICRIEVANHGTAPVANVEVQDNIPAGARLVASGRPYTPNQPSVLGPATVTFDVGTVPAQDRVFWEIGFKVEPTFVVGTPFGEKEICNEAMISQPMTLTGDQNREIDRDCDIVKERADLRVSKFVEPFSGVRAGETFTYTIYVDNLGPSASRNVTITDTLLSSGRVSIQSCAFSVSQGGGAITQFTCTTGNLVSTQFGTDIGTFRTSYLEPLSPTSQGRLRASFRLRALSDIDVTNTTRVTADTPDQDMSNNFAEAWLSVSKSADVSITKTDSGATPDAGESFSYQLTVTNNGVSGASDVKVEDTLPLGLQVTDIEDPVGGNCATVQNNTGNMVVQCNLGNLLPGASRTIIIDVTVGANVPAGAILINQATVSAAEFDPDTSNNIAREFTPVGQTSVLFIDKDATPNPVTAGGVIDYRIFVRNDGPSVAKNVVLDDEFTAGGQYVSFVSAYFQGGSGSCYEEDFVDTHIRCNLGDLAVGQFVRIDVRVAVDPATPAGNNVIVNDIDMRADSLISIDPSSDDDASVDVEAIQGITLSKVASDPSPTAGGELSYKITVKNNGPSTAFDVAVTDDLGAAGLELVSVSDNRCTADTANDTIDCAFGDMAPGAQISFDVFVRVPADFGCNAALRNVASATWDSNDDGLIDSDTATVTTVEVVCEADLRIEKIAKPDGDVPAGTPIEYTIVVDNLGPSVVGGVSIKDLLQSSGTFDVLSVESDRPATCNSLPDADGGDPFNPPGGEATAVDKRYQLDCGLDQDLDVLAADGPPNSGRWILTVTVMADTAQDLNNVATALSSEGTDPDQSNNQTDVVQRSVTELADLRIVKFGKRDGTVRAGDVLTYTVIVDNLGPNEATSVAVKDVLRSSGNFDVLELSSDRDMTCVTDPAGPLPVNNVVTSFDADCTLDDPLGVLQAAGFPNPGRWILTMRVQARTGQSINNVADVLAEQEDPDLSNNHAEVEHEITDVADLRLLKQGPATVNAGGTIQWTINVTNGGWSTAENVVVYDRLPAGVTVTAASVDVGGNCTTGAPGSALDRLQCNLGTLTAGQTRTITIDANVDPSLNAGDRLENDAFALSDMFDPNNGNNASHVLTTITTAADIQLTKAADPNPVLAGTVLEYAIGVRNAGPSTADNLRIFDLFDAADADAVELVGYNIVGGGGTCFLENVGTTDVRCNLGDLPPATTAGPQRVIYLRFAVDPDAKASDAPANRDLDNVVNVASDTPNVTKSGDDNEKVFVRYAQDVAITKSGTPDVVSTGEALTYSIQAVNNGPSTAFSVQVFDQLPTALTFLWVSDPACSVNGANVLSCNVGDMAPGESFNVDVHMQVPADYPCATAIQSNSATAVWDADNDPIGGDDDDSSVDSNTVVTDVNCVSDLQVQKVGKPDNSVAAGEPLEYTIIVDNHGPSIARGVSIKDVIIASGRFDVVSVESDRPATCNALPGGPFVPTGGAQNNVDKQWQLDCTLDAPLDILAADGPPNSGRWIVKVTVESDDAQSINNTVTALAANSTDPNLANNTAQTAHEVRAQANLSISKTDLPDCDPGADWPGNFCDMMGNGDTVAIAGSTDDPNDPQGESTFHWRLEVENEGPSDATNVVVTDNLPAEVEVTRIRKEPDQGACTTVQGAKGQQVVTCNLGTLGDDDEVRIDIYVRVPAGVADGTILWNEAWVTSDAVEPNNEDNRTRARTDVIAVADLGITKTDDPDPAFAAGGEATYTLNVVNHGPSVSRDVVVVDDLPTGLDGLSVDVVGVTDEKCSIGPVPGSSTGRERVTCELGDLGVGDARTILIRVKVAEDIVPADDANQCVNVRNVATVSAATKDPEDDNDEATESQEVCATADLKITKTSEPEKVNAGEQKRYHIEVENLGLADAQGVTVHDVLPDEATYEVDTNGAMCTQPANLVGFRAVMNAANEVPPAPGSGMGLATFVLDTTTNVLEYAIFVNDLSTATTAAHIHTGAAGLNGAALVGLFAGAPPVFDESHPLVGKVTLTPVQAAAILANPGGHYVNVHTTASPGGEIRGQLARALQTPLECEIGALAAGAKHAFDIFALIDADTMAGTTITNVALVFADVPPDGVLYNNADYSKNYVESKADLRVVKFGKPDAQVRAGDILTYTVIVDNLGPSSAKGVAIKDVLRASGTFDLINIDSDRDFECISDPNPASGAGTPADPLVPNNRQSLDIDCTLDGALGVLEADGFPNPGRWTLTMYVQADETQSINNVVDVLSAALDPKLENNHAQVEHEITDVSDMGIDKIGPMMVIAGDQLTYELVVTNHGPSTSENVVVYDRLPPGIVVTEATVVGGGGTCTTGTPANPLDKLECGLGTLNVGASKTVRIVATVSASVPAGTVLENDAFVLSDKFDDDNSNNYDTVLTTVKRAADLVVTKVSERNDVEDASDNAEPTAVAGETIEYTITVTNQGISDAADVLVVDRLPYGTEYLSANVTVGQGACLGLPTGEVKCQLGTMVAGATYEIVVRAQVQANYDCAARPNLINVVEATTSSETDPATLANNAYTLTTPVACVADVKVEKWSDPIKVYAGEQKKYTVRVTNLGPSDALNVVMEDTLPVEVEYDIDTGGCAVALGEPDVVTCDIGTLPPGGTYEVEIYTTVDPNTAPGTELVNEAVVTTTTADPDEDNNRDTSENLVLQKADLHVRKFGKPDGKVRAGDVLTYTVIVDNLGPSWANGVALKDVLQSSGDFDLIDILSDREASCRILPAGVVPTDVTLGATAWPPDAPPAAFGVTPPTGVSQIENRLEVDCTLTDPLAVLAADGPPNSGRWIVTMRVRARMTQDLNNVASVLSEAYDPDRTNNDAFVEHEITDVADLRIIKAQVDENGDPLPMPMIVAGTTMYYAITVTNGGPSTAENVVVTDRLPAGVTVTSASVEGGGSCTTGAAGSALDKLACGLGDLTTGSTKVVRVTADVSAWVPQGAVLENDAHVTSDIYDPDNGNNYAHVLTTVKTVADLGVEKYGNPDPIKAGDITSYEIVFRNNGPSVARDVILTDYLPGEFDLLRVYVVDGSPVSDSATCHTLTEDPGMADRATCELGDIAPGQEGRVVVIVRVKSDTPAGVYTNTVTIESDTAEPDPDETPNSATFDTTIAPMADLWIEKWSDPVKVNAGEQKKYTIRVTNLGPSDAENVVVTDTLPKEVDYEIDTGLCTVAANSGANGEDVVTCGFGTMKPGQVKTVDIYALVEPQTAPGSFIVNRADVTSDTPDGINEDNNTAYSENFVLQKADLKITKFGKMDDRVRAGEVLTYTVIVDNLGPSWASKAAVKDIIQTGGTFDFIDVRSDRAATCKVLPAGLVPTTVVLPAAAWPVVDPPPAFGVIAGNGVANIEQRLQVDCNLGGALEALEPNGPPNKGRWILTMRFRARQAQSVNNVASVVNVVPIEGDPSNGNLATDPDPSNNMAMVEHEITDVADLTVVKSATGQVVTGCAADGTTPVIANQANMVTAGLDLTYTLVVTNKGPSDAENVVVYDRLPPGVVLKSGTVDGSATKFANWCATGTPGSPLDKLVCGVGTLYSQPSAGKPNTTTIVFTVTVDPALANGAVLENDAYVASDVFDPINQNWANNLTTVKTSADLRLDKTDDHDPVVAGKLLRYTLGVTNDGPSVARDVWVYDDLPADVVYVGSIGAACYEDPVTAGNIACQVGDMAPGEMRFVYLIVQVKPDAAMTLTNTAVAQSGFSDDTPLPTGKLTSDPCPGDNTDTETTTVTRETDPFVMKTDLTDPVIAGKPARYQIMFGNNGPSTATKVDVLDVLPDGFMFNRCESIDPNDLVTCTTDAAMKTVTLQSIKLKNTVVWTSDKANAANTLDPGESYTFVIVADVSPGYVLDGQTDGAAGKACEAYAKASDYLFWGWDRATIASLSNVSQKEVDTNLNNNFDDECTRVNAEADLSIVKTDIFGNPATDPGNYFLECDPVEPGGMITYDLTVKNNGMSDAAQVQVVDQLPAEFVVLDPAKVTITFPDGVGTGQIVEVRDDGKITLLLGNDPFRKGPNAVPAPAKRQLGRINAGSTYRARIQVMVVNPWATMEDKRFVNPMPPYDKICGALLLNTATVSTIKGPAVLPGNVPGWPLKDQTPTADPDLTNNTDTETTKIECPAIQVEKTVSYDGQCPGSPVPTVFRQGAMVTFCIEITNVGTTYLDQIEIVDTLRTSMGEQVFKKTVTYGKDPKMPVAPGESVMETIMVPPLTDMCGTVSNTVEVTAIPVNSGRTVYPCLSPVAHDDRVEIFVPCSGADFRIQLPALDTGECETWLQVQNVGSAPTVGFLVVWGEAGACPPQAAGPLKVECTGLLKPGSAWTYTTQNLPPGIRSGIMYSLNATNLIQDERGNELPFSDLACDELFFAIVGDHDEWLRFDYAYSSGGRYVLPNRIVLDFGENQGQPLVVSVNRTCPDPVDPNRNVSAAYVGVGTYLEGAMDPVFGQFAYYAPLVFANKGGLNSWLWIHNSGTRCSSIEIWFKGQDNCLRPILGDVLAVAPGESVHFDPNTVVGPDWLGSAWIRASQPLGIVVDTMGPNHFTSYVGFPSDTYDDAKDTTYSIGSQVNYAPLIYSEYQGWDAAIQVQNLSGTTAAKVKVYFLDRSGDVITTVVDWICPRGSQTFFLPVIAGLSGNWVGHARVESQEWWTPGTKQVDPPRIQSVVLLEKWADPARSERREAVAYNALTEQVAFDWQVGKLAGGTQSGSAVLAVPLLAKGNRGVNSELAITNLVTKPGFTDFAIILYDQNALIDFVCQKLHDRQVEYIDLATWGYVPQRFLGSAVISATFWEHEVFDPNGGFQRNLVGLGGVVVERINGTLGAPDVPGDESKAFEAVPIFDFFTPQRKPTCTGQPSFP